MAGCFYYLHTICHVSHTTLTELSTVNIISDEDELLRVPLNTMATRWNHTPKMMAMDPVKQIMMTTRRSNFLEEVKGLNNTTAAAAAAAAAAVNTKWG